MLRASSRQSFIEKLENSYFGLSNFSIDFAEGNPNIVTIKFIPNNRFTFKLDKSNYPKPFRSVEAPGEKFLVAENFDLADLSTAFSRLEKWLVRLHEELISSNPFVRELSELRSNLEAAIDQMGINQEDFFTNSEAADLRNKLDQMASKVAELTSRAEGAEESIANLIKAINDLKEATTIVNRGTWYRMGSGRLISGLKSLATSKEAREFALEAAKKFLLEGPK